MKTLCLSLVLLLSVFNATGLAQTKAKPATDMDHFFAGFDPGGNWVYLTSSDYLRYYYDKTTLKRIGNIVRVWVGEWPSPEGVEGAKWRQNRINQIERAGMPAENYYAYQRTNSLSEYDCINDRSRLLKIVDYDNKGEIIESLDIDGEWTYAIPQSVGYATLKNLCNPNYKPPPSRPLRRKDLEEFANGTASSEDTSTTEAEPQTRLKRAENKKSPDPFVARYVGGDGPPTVTVKNNTNRTLTLVLGGSKYLIPSTITKTVTMSSGFHDWIASASGVNSLQGTKQFESGYIYSWEFLIRTTTVGGGVRIPGRRRSRRP